MALQALARFKFAKTIALMLNTCSLSIDAILSGTCHILITHLNAPHLLCASQGQWAMVLPMMLLCTMLLMTWILQVVSFCNQLTTIMNVQVAIDEVVFHHGNIQPSPNPSKQNQLQ
jgi:hypothetical protein